MFFFCVKQLIPLQLTWDQNLSFIPLPQRHVTRRERFNWLVSLASYRMMVRDAGLFLFVEVADLGLVLQWDHGTRAHIRLDPKWKGLVSRTSSHPIILKSHINTFIFWFYRVFFFKWIIIWFDFILSSRCAVCAVTSTTTNWMTSSRLPAAWRKWKPTSSAIRGVSRNTAPKLLRMW